MDLGLELHSGTDSQLELDCSVMCCSGRGVRACVRAHTHSRQTDRGRAGEEEMFLSASERAYFAVLDVLALKVLESELCIEHLISAAFAFVVASFLHPPRRFDPPDPSLSLFISLTLLSEVLLGCSKNPVSPHPLSSPYPWL